MSARLTPFRDRENAVNPQRPLPRAIDAERCVLGAIVATDGAVLRRTENLTVEHFSAGRNQTIFRHMCVEYEDSGSVSMIALRSRLRDSGDLEKIGGLPALDDACEANPDIARIERYAADIVKAAWLRLLITTSEEIAADADLRSVEDYEAMMRSIVDAFPPRADDLMVDVLDLGLSEGPPAEQTFVVADLIPAGWWTSLYAKTGSAKSFLSLYIAFCIALGRPFFGRQVQQGPVLYLDAELDAETFERRAWMIARGLGVGIPRGLWYHRLTGSLTDAKCNHRVKARIEKIRPRLTIIDSFTAALRGRDSNSVDDVTGRLLDALKGFGTVLIIDHTTSKSVEIGPNVTPIGSSTKQFFVRSALFMACNSNAAVLRQDKSSFGAQTDHINFALNWSPGFLTLDPLASDDPRLAGLEQAMTAKDQLRAAFAQGDYDEGAPAKQIATDLGLKHGTVRNALGQLKAERFVQSSAGKWYPADARTHFS